MKEILEFLLARLAEDEQIAQAATPGPWDLNMIQPDMGGNHQYGLRSATTAGPIGAVSAGAFRMRAGDARHIARHDPARVLAEVEAKRRIVDRHQRTVTKSMPVFDEFDSPWAEVCAECGTHRGRYHAPCLTLRLLALPYADHPDYRQEWRP